MKKAAKYKKLASVNPEKKTREAAKARVFDGLAEFAKNRGYRADLVVSAASKKQAKIISAVVKFDKQLGFPHENDLMALVASKFPTHQIDWATIEADTEGDTLSLNLQPKADVIPLNSVKDIPNEFKSIGSGIFKRRAVAAGNVFEIWELKREADGLSLVRKMDDVETDTENDSAEVFSKGDLVETEHGAGKITDFDPVGNAIVQVGSHKRIVAQEDMKKYEPKKDQKALLEYYTSLYGAEFAQGLIKDFSDPVMKK
ncbi:MAG: hypothetical protein WC444_05485 [Candidatus Paceibacterota bacterium]